MSAPALIPVTAENCGRVPDCDHSSRKPDPCPLNVRLFHSHPSTGLPALGDGVDAALPLTASRCAILVVSKHKLKERASMDVNVGGKTSHGAAQ